MGEGGEMKFLCCVVFVCLVLGVIVGWFWVGEFMWRSNFPKIIRNIWGIGGIVLFLSSILWSLGGE